jgi:hypothetical protein
MPAAVTTDLVQIQRTAVAQADENSCFRTFVELEVELSDRRLNTIVNETTAEVWQHIDCRTCANCCRSQHPTFSRPEVQRIAAYLGITVEELRRRYLTSDADSGKYITRELPCPLGIRTCTATFAPVSGRPLIMLLSVPSSITSWRV